MMKSMILKTLISIILFSPFYRVLLKVYDVLGQVVGILVDGDEKAGNKFVNFDARNLPSGVYYYRLTAGKFSKIKKMLLVR